MIISPCLHQPSHHESTRAILRSVQPLLRSGKPYSLLYYLNMPTWWHQDLRFQKVYLMSTIQQLVQLLAVKEAL